MKRINLLLVLVICSASSIIAQNINLSPAILRFSATPTGSESERILIQNNGDAPQILQLFVGDWHRDETGEHKYFEPGTLGESCAKWINLSHKIVEIPAQSDFEITVSIAPPAEYDMNDMKWAMLFIRGVVEKQEPLNPANTLSTTIEETFQFGVHIYNTPAGLTETRAKVTNLSKLEAEQGFNLTVENVGKTQLKGEAMLIMTHKETGDEFDVSPTEAPIFPGYKRIFPLTVPDSLPSGEYDVLGLFDYGETYEMEGMQTEFTKP